MYKMLRLLVQRTANQNLWVALSLVERRVQALEQPEQLHHRGALVIGKIVP